MTRVIDRYTHSHILQITDRLLVINYLSRNGGFVGCSSRLGLSGAAVSTSAGGGAVPANEVSVKVHRTCVGTLSGGGGEQRPTTDGGDQRAGGDHFGSAARCPCIVYRGSASRHPSCRRVGVRVTTHRCRCRCVNGRLPHSHPRHPPQDCGCPVSRPVCVDGFAHLREGWRPDVLRVHTSPVIHRLYWLTARDRL